MIANYVVLCMNLCNKHMFSNEEVHTVGVKVRNNVLLVQHSSGGKNTVKITISLILDAQPRVV